MSQAQSSSPAALPIAHAVLKILIIVNWVGGAAIAALLLMSKVHEPWIMSAFDLEPSPDTDQLVRGLRIVAVIGLISIPLYHFILTRLLAMVETVRAGDPFVAENADRLRTIAWAQLVLQLLSMTVGAIGDSISSSAHPLHFDAGFSIGGWLAVLFTFLLARVFAEGAQMRKDLEGTV
jgi:hypothetical protein